MRQQITTTEEKVALDKELMAQKLVQAEREAQASLREQRAVHKEDLQRLQREKVQAAGLGQVVGWGRALNHCLCLLCDLRRVPSHSASVKWNFISVSGALGAAGRILRGPLLIKHADSQAPIWSSPGDPDAGGPRPYLENADLM